MTCLLSTKWIWILAENINGKLAAAPHYVATVCSPPYCCHSFFVSYSYLDAMRILQVLNLSNGDMLTSWAYCRLESCPVSRFCYYYHYIRFYIVHKT